jgi:hypothetical protein
MVVGGLLAASLLKSSTIGIWLGVLVAFIGVLVLVAGSSLEAIDYFVRGPRARVEERLGKRPRPPG